MCFGTSNFTIPSAVHPARQSHHGNDDCLMGSRPLLPTAGCPFYYSHLRGCFLPCPIFVVVVPISSSLLPQTVQFSWLAAVVFLPPAGDCVYGLFVTMPADLSVADLLLLMKRPAFAHIQGQMEWPGQRKAMESNNVESKEHEGDAF